MTNYGTRLALILSNLQENSKKEEKDLLKALNIRVIFITIIMSLIFAIRAVYNLLFTWGLIPRYFPDTLNPVFWEAIVIHKLKVLLFIFIVLNYIRIDTLCIYNFLDCLLK